MNDVSGPARVPALFATARADHLDLPRSGAGTRADPGSPGPWTPPGTVPFEENLLARTLAFADSYVSDDGQVTVRRSPASAGYSGARFAGHCAVCSRAGLLTAAGEALFDVRAAVQFVAAHSHGDHD
jgi:hypothetical protein